MTYAILTIAEAGDNIVSSSTLYGGTYNLFAHTLPQYGITTRFADPRDIGSFEKQINERTKAIFAESVGNPLGTSSPTSRAGRAGAPPRPAADRRQHRALAVPAASDRARRGHRGAVADQVPGRSWHQPGRRHHRLGQVPWAEHKARFKRLNEPDISYHGVVYTEAFGPAAYIGRARVVPLRNTGAAISPFNSFQILQGIETLALRVDRIVENAVKVAGFLREHPKVEWVNYAGLPDHADHALVQKYLGGKAPGLFTFGVKGGREAGARFQDALQLFTRLVNIGDAKSLATHPASTTHRQLNPEELQKAGVREETVRLSIGIEHIDDLIADLDQALAQV